MKKMLLLAGLIAALALPTHAASYKYQSFIPGYQPPINASDTAGASVSLLLNTNYTGTLWTNAVTNVLANRTGGWTNTMYSNNITWFVQGAAFGYTYGTSSALVTNAYINPGELLLNSSAFYVEHVGGLTNTAGNTVDGSGFSAVDVPSDYNGNPASGKIIAFINSDVSGGTNLVTLTFAPSYDGISIDTADTITLSGNCSGTASVPLVTNLTTAQMTGVKKFYLYQAGCATNSPADLVFMSGCGFSTFIP